VVDMEDGNALQINGAVDEFECGSETRFTLDVITGGKKMRGVEARADFEVSQRVQHLAEFFQARAERGAHARGVLEENAKRSRRQIFCGLFDRFDREPR